MSKSSQFVQHPYSWESDSSGVPSIHQEKEDHLIVDIRKQILEERIMGLANRQCWLERLFVLSKSMALDYCRLFSRDQLELPNGALEADGKLKRFPYLDVVFPFLDSLETTMSIA